MYENFSYINIVVPLFILLIFMDNEYIKNILKEERYYCDVIGRELRNDPQTDWQQLVKPYRIPE